MEMVKKRRKGKNTYSNNKMQKYKFWDLLANPPTMSLILLLCSNVWGGKHGGEHWSKLTEQPGTIFNVRKRKTQTSRMIGNVAKEEKLAKNLRAMSRDFSWFPKFFRRTHHHHNFVSAMLYDVVVFWHIAVLLTSSLHLSFSHHYQESIDFNTVNIHRTAGCITNSFDVKNTVRPLKIN